MKARRHLVTQPSCWWGIRVPPTRLTLPPRSPAMFLAASFFSATLSTLTAGIVAAVLSAVSAAAAVLLAAAALDLVFFLVAPLALAVPPLRLRQSGRGTVGSPLRRMVDIQVSPVPVGGRVAAVGRRLGPDPEVAHQQITEIGAKKIKTQELGRRKGGTQKERKIG